MKLTYKKIYYGIVRRVLDRIDASHDRRICGQDLTKYVPSVYRDDENGIGSTGSQSTRYWFLDKIFPHVSFSPDDVFLDVGCGKGRVLAYLIEHQCPCEINGIEINESSGNVAAEWTRKYPNVNVMIGNAFDLNYDKYTVLFIGRPFLPVTFMEFITKLESDLTHPVKLIYWVDQQSGYLLKDREGWTLQYREKLQRIRGINIEKSPQGFSIWEYAPNQS